MRIPRFRSWPSRSFRPDQGLGIRTLMSLAAAAALAVTSACNDDPSQLNLPVPSIVNIWPHDDGRSWTFDLQDLETDHVDVRIYPARAQVPAALPASDVLAALRKPLPAPVTSMQGTSGLLFRGTKITESGATGQNLVDTLLTGVASGKGRSERSAAGFLATLASVRPDLAPRIRDFVGGERIRLADPYPPLLLGHGAWENTSTYIGTYGDIDRLLAWKYLEADLRVGHEFTHQLVPSLANDVFLHARVVGRGTATTAAGTFKNAIVVAYVVDYGISEALNGDQSSAGFYRSTTYGIITFAPEVGPVACRERFTGGYNTFENEGPVPVGMAEVEVRLIATGPDAQP